MPYQAQRQPLFGIGAPNYVRPQIDVGGAIDAATGAARSLVQDAYTRGLQQREMGMRQQQLELEQQRESRESAAQDRELGIREQEARARNAALGYQPASTSFSQEMPAASPALNVPPTSRVATAMISGLPQEGGTTPLTRPGPVDLGTYPKTTVTETPESYDPTRSAAYVRGMGLVGARGDIQSALLDRRLQAQQALEGMREAGRSALANLRGGIQATNQSAHDARVAARAGGANGGQKPMTAGQRATWRQKTAEGIVGANGGSYDDAVAWLNSDEGKDLRAQGLSPQDLFVAHGHLSEHAADAATRLVGGSAMMTPEEAVGAVNDVRRRVRQGASAPPPDSSASAPVAAPAGVGKPVGKQQAKSAAAPAAAAPVAAPAAPASQRRALNAREKTAAQTDPGFATFLKQKGYTAKDWGAKTP